MDAAALLRRRTRETRIRRDATGRWFDGEQRITHVGVVQALDGYIDVAEDGRLCLRNDINWAYATIEGPPYFVRSVTLAGERVTLHLSGGCEEALDPESLTQDEAGALYCRVRGGRLLARFDNHAASGLAPLLDEDDFGVYLSLAGRRVRPPVQARDVLERADGDDE
jgi:hypothetical protein